MMQGHAMGMIRSGEGDLTRLFTAERIAGRLAHLRGEIAITDTQASSWNNCSEVVRAHVKRLDDARLHIASVATASNSASIASAGSMFVPPQRSYWNIRAAAKRS